VQPRTKPQLNAAPAMARYRRPRPVKRQRDLLGKPGEPIPPKRKLARDHAASLALIPKNRSLPQRVIRILHRQRRKSRNTTQNPRRVAARKIPTQRTKRPAVPGNVMQHQQQHVLVRPKRKQMRPQRQLARYIKTRLRRARQRPGKLRFSQSAPQKPNTTPTRFDNLLARYPVTLRKDRAQALVPLNNIPKRSFQRRNIQRTTQPNRQRHRVGRTTSLHPLQNPQPTLRKRQRNFRRTSNRAQRRTTRPRFPQTLHKPTNRPRFKQAADRNLNTKARSDPADQTRRKQRVSTQLKKVVLNPNPLDPQNPRKHPAQQLLLRRARKTPNAGAKLRRRQRSSVQLPVRRQRKTIQNNNRRRHHVIGKPRTNMRAQLASFRRTTRSQNNVANKLAAARIAAARNHRSLRYAPMPQKRSLDLPKLNAKSANLNLMVRATHKLQTSIPAPARQVPAAVHPTPRSPKPIRNKTLRCQTTTTQIPPPNSRTRNVKPPNNPNRHRLQTTIQNVNTRVPYRPTNGNIPRNVTDL